VIQLTRNNIDYFVLSKNYISELDYFDSSSKKICIVNFIKPLSDNRVMYEYIIDFFNKNFYQIKWVQLSSINAYTSIFFERSYNLNKDIKVIDFYGELKRKEDYFLTNKFNNKKISSLLIFIPFIVFDSSKNDQWGKFFKSRNYFFENINYINAIKDDKFIEMLFSQISLRDSNYKTITFDNYHISIKLLIKNLRPFKNKKLGKFSLNLYLKSHTFFIFCKIST
jgi:hypothetical protein